jgi:hypothetical protein
MKVIANNVATGATAVTLPCFGYSQLKILVGSVAVQMLFNYQKTPKEEGDYVTLTANKEYLITGEDGKNFWNIWFKSATASTLTVTGLNEGFTTL